MYVEKLAKQFFCTDLFSHSAGLNIKLKIIDETIIVMFELTHKMLKINLPTFNHDFLSNSYEYF